MGSAPNADDNSTAINESKPKSSRRFVFGDILLISTPVTLETAFAIAEEIPSFASALLGAADIIFSNISADFLRCILRVRVLGRSA